MKNLNLRWKNILVLSCAALIGVSTNTMFSAACFAQSAAKTEVNNMRDGKAVGGIVYNQGGAFTLAAPTGWIWDGEAGREQGIMPVFYPTNGSWEDSPSVMYTRTQPKKGKTLEEAIKFDIDYMKQRTPNVSTTDGDPIAYGKEDKKAQVRYLNSEGNNSREAIAYMDEGDWVNLVILTSRNASDFKESLPAFQKLVGSYVRIAKEVKIEK